MPLLLYILIMAVLIIIVTYSIMKSASDADDQMEKWFEEKQREQHKDE